jgi:hypothetical protein
MCLYLMCAHRCLVPIVRRVGTKEICRQPRTYVKPEAAITVFEHLTMSGVSLETCWAIKKHWNNKFYYTVASCWLFLYDLYCDARIHEHQALHLIKMSPCAFTWCVHTGVWCLLFDALVRKKFEGWSWEPSGLFWNRRDISLQPVSWKSKVSVGGYGLCSGGYRTRSFSW